MKIAVVGSRRYRPLDAVRQFVAEQERTTVIVSGGAAGVDNAALEEAKRLGMPYELHLPDWNRYGKAAGPIRDEAIVQSADEVVAFWDGQSRGTERVIRFARNCGKPLLVFNAESRR